MKRNLGRLFLLLLLGMPCSARGQVMEGHVRSVDGDSIPGVLVLAVDSLNFTQTSWITGESGVFRLTVPYPGKWTLRAERIGFGVTEKEVLVGDEDLSGISIEMLTVPVVIEGVEVSVGKRCPGASASPGVAELWREARSVLTSVRRTQTAGASQFEVSFHRRDYRLGGFDPEFLHHESTDTVVATGMVPMRSASPEFLASQGFIVLTDDTASYYAPDADVLLSDEFLTGHCFRREEREEGGPWVGLGFDPIDPTALDIRGTFWLPTSPEVWPFIEFTWTNHPWDLKEVLSPVSRGLSVEPARLEGRVGGRVELSFVEGIGWIVHRWWMRWPVPIHLKSDWGGPPPGTYLGLIREWDVELIRVLHAESSPSGEPDPAPVRWDRSAVDPLPTPSLGLEPLSPQAAEIPEPTRSPETLEAEETVRKALRRYYWEVPSFGGTNVEDFGPVPHREFGDSPKTWGWDCSLDDDEMCDGGDWERGICGMEDFCHPSVDKLVTLLQRSGRDYPESGYIVGQAVGTLVRLGRHLEALELAESCSAEPWWCSALRGHVFQAAGRPTEAEAGLLRLLTEAPDTVACQFQTAPWLPGSRPRREVDWGTYDIESEGRPPPFSCGVEAAVADTLFWLADPLYVVEGNDRLVEHLDRGLKALLHRQIFEETLITEVPFVQTPFAGWAIYWPDIIRRGPWDSYRGGPGTEMVMWTSRTAARYHFVPDFVGEGFGDPIWRLNATREYEGYTPPYGPFHEVPIQVARFRNDSADEGAPSMRVALASTLRGTPLFALADSAHLVLTDAPGSFPLVLTAPVDSAGRARFLAEAAPERYVSSVEILGEAGVGRHREMLEPLDVLGPGLSDILLFEPKGYDPPTTIVAATSTMYGSLDLQDVHELGIYWEVYGAEAETSIEHRLRIEREDGGFIDRLRRLLPGGPEDGSGTLTWEVPSTGITSPVGVGLDIRNLGPGDYSLVIRSAWEGQTELERTVSFTVNQGSQ